MVEQCKHELPTRICTWCNSSPKRRSVTGGRVILSKLESTCRLCQQPIHVGVQITRRIVPSTISYEKPKWVWAHTVCESYVVTREERHRAEGRRDPIGLTPRGNTSRYQITRLAEELDETDEEE